MSTPATPKPPTAEELLAVAAPEAPKELEFKFPDGTVVKGKTQEDLLAAAAKRYDDVSKHAKEVKEENAALRAAVQPPPAATPSATTGFDQNTYWNLMNTDPAQAQAYALASWLGFETPAEMKATLEGTVSVARDVTERSLASGFMALAPDFPATKEASDILVARMDEMGIQRPTVEGMLAVHALCLKEGKYQPAEAVPATPVAPPAPTIPQPPPMIQQGAAAVTGIAPNMEEMANNMTAAQLKEAILKMQAGGSQ